MMFSFPTRHLQCWVTTGCPKKSYIQKLLDPECTRSITSSRHPSQLDLDKLVSGTYLGRFLSRLSRIKRSQVMSMGRGGRGDIILLDSNGDNDAEDVADADYFAHGADDVW